MAEEHALIALARRYPQLLLPVDTGMRSSELYRRAVLRGDFTPGVPDFSLDERDTLSECETPAGRVEVLFLAERKDFEHAYRALACRCEPTEIPASVGASFITGLINWEKIRTHREEYIASGGENWSEEFARFTSRDENYRDTLLLLSAGEYSAVPAEMTGLSRDEWLKRSVTIRKYHELTHFICRRLWGGDVQPLRDEVIADLIGLLAAFGEYDTRLAEILFGVEDDSFRKGGRLSHYVSADALAAACETVRALIAEYAEKLRECDTRDVFAVLCSIFPEKE